MKNIEIEIQVNIEKIGSLKKFLDENAKFISEKREIDQYFTPKHKNFTETTPISEWLRLRDTESKFSINYKLWHQDKNGKTNHCTEYETGIEKIEQLENILQALDFKHLVTVDKVRKKYRYIDYEIVIDKVKGLPETVEVEFKGETENTPSQIAREMLDFLKELKVGQMKRSYQGYPFLLLFPEKAEYEFIN